MKKWKWSHENKNLRWHSYKRTCLPKEWRSSTLLLRILCLLGKIWGYLLLGSTVERCPNINRLPPLKMQLVTNGEKYTYEGNIPKFSVSMLKASVASRAKTSKKLSLERKRIEEAPHKTGGKTLSMDKFLFQWGYYSRSGPDYQGQAQ